MSAPENQFLKSGEPDYLYTLMFYNVENLFHPSNDSLSGDDPFTPGGIRHWTFGKYKQKISSICKLILAAGGWEPPIFVGLCELENDKVLKDLIYHPLLLNYNYKFLHRDSPDHRGIDVALLYRSDRVRYISHSFIENKLPGNSYGTRDILLGTFELQNDTLNIFVNHWTSKYGGSFETEEKRLYQADLLSGVVDTLYSCASSHKMIICGDFNDNSSSAPISCLTHNGTIREIIPGGKTSYKYHGKWDLIDHVFVAGNWTGDQLSAEIFTAPFLLEKDEKFTGEKPFRTYSGYSYHGGISDHLPVLLHFNLEELAVD